MNFPTAKERLRPLLLMALLTLATGPLFAKSLLPDCKKDLTQANYPALMAQFNADLAKVKQDGCNTDLQAFYEGLAKWEYVKELQNWARLEPKNHVPWTAIGMACLSEGDKYRGTDYIKTVSKADLKVFYQCLDSAKSYLDRATQLNPDDPEPYTALLEIGLHEGWSTGHMEPFFQKALQSAPGYESAVWTMGLHHSPLWGGSDHRMNQFVSEYCRTAPKGSYLRLLVVRYHEEIWKTRNCDRNYFAGDSRPWREVKQEFEDYLAIHPDDLSTRSWYSSLAFSGEHFVEAKQQFDVLGDRWDANSSHWLTQQGYMTAKRIANHFAR